MTQKEIVAIVRLLTDLIKADTVIDIREIELFEEICKEFNIDVEIATVEAQNVSLADAVKDLDELTKSEREVLVKKMESLTIADGKCEPEEALLLLALRGVIQGNGEGYLDSCAAVTNNIAPFTVFYVESDYDKETNDAIITNYRTIENEFRLAGFDFVYIPHKSSQFSSIEKHKLMSIICHIAPTVASADAQMIYDKICTLDTENFCRSLLYNKLGLSSLYDTEPSLLVKIGSSRVSLKLVHNYFKFMISGNVLDDVRYFVDSYKSIAKDEKIIVRQVEPHCSHFEYSGFNKSIFDLLAFPGKAFESRILIDTARHRIFFEDINAELELTAYERSLYTFLLYASVMGKVVRRNETSEVRKSRLDAAFNKIYNMVGKWENDEVKTYKSPNIASSLSRIRKRINSLELLENKKLYLPESADDVLSLKVDPEKVYVLDSMTGKKMLMRDSDVWCKL